MPGAGGGDRCLALGAVIVACALAVASPAGAASRLLGDPGGVRTRLARRGLDLQLFYNQILAWTPSGGPDGDSRTGHSGTYDLFARADLERLVGAPGLTALLHAKGQYDRNLNEDVGALSDPVDDADFDEQAYVDQLYLQQHAFEDRLWLRAGFFEQQTVYDRNAYANHEDRQFMNAFLDNDPVVPLPGALGAAVWVQPVPWLELAAGVADADNPVRSAGFETLLDGGESLNAYLELALHVALPSEAGPLEGTWRAGAFRDGREKAAFGRIDRGTGAPDRERGHLGFWVSVDQAVFRERGAPGQGLGLFFRYGHAGEDVNRIARFYSAGLQYDGLLPRRGDDTLGLAFYHAVASDRFRDSADDAFARETGVELYYRVALRPWLALTPDLQYIVNAGGSARGKDRVLAALRLRIAF